MGELFYCDPSNNPLLRFKLREDAVLKYPVLNDEQPISGSVIDALNNYGIRPVPWTKRSDVLAQLAA